MIDSRTVIHLSAGAEEPTLNTTGPTTKTCGAANAVYERNHRKFGCSRYLDPAGEWSADNVKFQEKWAQLSPTPELVYRHTAVDKRFNAHGEVTMRVIEEVAKAIMLDTRLEAEMWTYAVDHAIYILNLTTMGCSLR